MLRQSVIMLLNYLHILQYNILYLWKKQQNNQLTGPSMNQTNKQSSKNQQKPKKEHAANPQTKIQHQSQDKHSSPTNKKTIQQNSQKTQNSLAQVKKLTQNKQKPKQIQIKKSTKQQVKQQKYALIKESSKQNKVMIGNLKKMIKQKNEERTQHKQQIEQNNQSKRTNRGNKDKNIQNKQFVQKHYQNALQIQATKSKIFNNQKYIESYQNNVVQTNSFKPMTNKNKSQSQYKGEKENKIKLNQSRIQNHLKLASTLMTPQQISNSVNFTKKHKERLKQYFKCICQRIYSYPKNSTFQHVKNMFNTINLTEWMVYCKQMKITDKFKSLQDGVKLLSTIFKKYQDIERRVNFQGFIICMKQIIIQLLQNNIIDENANQQKQLTKDAKIKDIFQFLCLNNKKRHINKLKQMGVMCSQQIYCINPPNYTESARSKQNVHHRYVKNEKQSLTCTKQSNQDEVIKQYRRTIPYQLPKIYKTNDQRKQSQIMHKLAVHNLNQVNPAQDVKKSLGKFSDNDDKFLKMYFNKQEKTKNTILKKLDQSMRLKSIKLRI